MTRERGRHPVVSRGPLLVALLIACLAAANAAAGDPDDSATGKPSTPRTNKLTIAYYDFSSGRTGMDINLRHTFESSTAWIGGYHQNDRFDQTRVGYEYDYHRGWLTLVPSAQAASHGFLGATLYGEAGRRCFGLGGMGRTNLRPYWNLGFDPNDYVQFGAGCRDHSGNTFSLSTIHDNRLDTGQTNTHVLVRRYLPGDWRVTVDAVNEHGHGEGDLLVNAWAVSVDVDWRRWFLRVAEDPHVNYTAYRQLRMAAGFRF